MRTALRRLAASLILLFSASSPAFTQAGRDHGASKPPAGPCDEYLSKSSCQVIIDMKSVGGPVNPQYRVAAPVRSDVTVNSGATVTTVLRQSSPFLSCTIAATPGAPARDLSASITSLLTSLGTFVLPASPIGLVTQAEKLAAEPTPEDLREIQKAPPGTPPTPEQSLAQIEDERKELASLMKIAAGSLKAQSDEFQNAYRQDWRYSFAPDPGLSEEEPESDDIKNRMRPPRHGPR